MKRAYLGDSYDAVKRLWQELLAPTAPLFAEPRFIPAELQLDFTRLTGIPILSSQPPGVFSILNDPDTGIRLPGEENQSESRTHISISTVLEQLQRLQPRCVITFDQSDYRHGHLARDEQRRAKIASLSEAGASGFYYVSHAPFLFAFSTSAALREIHELLIHAGIPANRLETIDHNA
jgi:hypothetical protein